MYDHSENIPGKLLTDDKDAAEIHNGYYELMNNLNLIVMVTLVKLYMLLSDRTHIYLILHIPDNIQIGHSRFHHQHVSTFLDITILNGMMSQ